MSKSFKNNKNPVPTYSFLFLLLLLVLFYYFTKPNSIVLLPILLYTPILYFNKTILKPNIYCTINTLIAKQENFN